MICERGKRLLAGIERADSISLDAHKWLFQPFEAGCVLVRDVATLVRAFSVNPDYLQDTKLGLEQVNFADRGYQLTRSSVHSSVDVHPDLRACPVSARRSRRAMGSRIGGALVASTAGLELLSPPSLGVLCFRYRPVGAAWTPDRVEKLNENIQARVIESGTAMISSTRLRGTYSLRLCIMSHQTVWDDVRETIEGIAAFGMQLARE